MLAGKKGSQPAGSTRRLHDLFLLIGRCVLRVSILS